MRLQIYGRTILKCDATNGKVTGGEREREREREKAQLHTKEIKAWGIMHDFGGERSRALKMSAFQLFSRPKECVFW